MAISYFSQAENAGLFIGLAADTKPTSPATGLMFIESDTGKVFYAEGAAWVEKLNPGYPIASAGTPSGGTINQVLKKNSATNYDYSWATIAGGGDVVGPVVSVASQITLFDGITGKLLKADTTTGIVKATVGVISAAVGDTDFALPATVALKAPLASPTFTGTVAGITAEMVGAQPLDSDLTTIAGLTATTDNFMVANASAWASRTPAQAKTSLALVKGDVGLGNVDNTTDLNKPISTATQTALDLKAPLASPTFTGTVTLPNDTVAYSKIQNVSAISKLLGRGSAAGVGDVEEITLGTNLSMSGTTLNATGGGSVSATTVEKDLGATATWRGRFTITDAGISASSKIMCWQATGPYTGKGTRADEAEMQPITITSSISASGSAIVNWETVLGASMVPIPRAGGQPVNATAPGLKDSQAISYFVARRRGLVRGNVKFNYMILS